MTRVSAGESEERVRERGRARGRDGGGMRQGEIVQCQGYMGARAQNRPYAEERGRKDGWRSWTEVNEEEGRRKNGRERGQEEQEEEDQLALAGCSPVGISCISRLHLVCENIMPIACASAAARTWPGLLSKHVEFIWAGTAASERAQATLFVLARYVRPSCYVVRVPRNLESESFENKKDKRMNEKEKNRFCKKVDAISKTRTTCSRISVKKLTAGER